VDINAGNFTRYLGSSFYREVIALIGQSFYYPKKEGRPIALAHTASISKASCPSLDDTLSAVPFHRQSIGIVRSSTRRQIPFVEPL